VRRAALTGDWTASGAEDPLADFSITDFSGSEPLEEGVTVSVTAKLAASAEWPDGQARRTTTPGPPRRPVGPS